MASPSLSSRSPCCACQMCDSIDHDEPDSSGTPARPQASWIVATKTGALVARVFRALDHADPGFQMPLPSMTFAPLLDQGLALYDDQRPPGSASRSSAMSEAASSVLPPPVGSTASTRRMPVANASRTRPASAIW